MIGKVQRVPLREVWRHEALDFTRWLENNVDVLSDALGLTLVNVEREYSVGAFSVDLVAEDEQGATVIIENQLERSDHDHLGKLITYLTALDAKTAVWIVAAPRPEHVTAIAWLNESLSASFYLLQVEAVRIGDSAPAPLLTKIVGPSDEARDVGGIKKELAERQVWRQEFWTGLLAIAKGKTKLHSGVSPGRQNWLAAGAGISGVSFTYTILKQNGGVELYMGRDAEADNSRLFDALLAQREAIETAFGAPLEWHGLEGKKACRIYHRIDGGGYRDKEHWPAIQAAMTDAMARFEAALRPHLAELNTVVPGRS